MKDPVAYLKTLIRDVPDFPKKGVLFRDITPLLSDPSGLALSIELLANPFRGKNVDTVVGAESRGFIFATAGGRSLPAGFGLARKQGEMLEDWVSVTYDLQYAKASLAMHAHTIDKGTRAESWHRV